MSDINPAQAVVSMTTAFGIGGFIASAYLSTKMSPEARVPVSQAVVAGGIIMIGTGIATYYLLKSAKIATA